MFCNLVEKKPLHWNRNSRYSKYRWRFSLYYNYNPPLPREMKFDELKPFAWFVSSQTERSILWFTMDDIRYTKDDFWHWHWSWFWFWFLTLIFDEQWTTNFEQRILNNRQQKQTTCALCDSLAWFAVKNNVVPLWWKLNNIRFTRYDLRGTMNYRQQITDYRIKTKLNEQNSLYFKYFISSKSCGLCPKGTIKSRYKSYYDSCLGSIRGREHH